MNVMATEDEDLVTHFRASPADPRVTERYLRNGADPNQRDAFGAPLLFCAWPIENKRLLLAAGADVNAQDRHGKTSLLQACLDRQAEVVELLIDTGADPNLGQPPSGRWKIPFPPLHAVLSRPVHPQLRSSVIQIVEALVEAGADATVRDPDGRSVVDRVVGLDLHESYRLFRTANSDAGLGYRRAAAVSLDQSPLVASRNKEIDALKAAITARFRVDGTRFEVTRNREYEDVLYTEGGMITRAITDVASGRPYGEGQSTLTPEEATSFLAAQPSAEPDLIARLRAILAELESSR